MRSCLVDRPGPIASPVWKPRFRRPAYIELKDRSKDRSKDIIISGGENISTIEVKAVLHAHPDVLEAAVVAQPDAQGARLPCAFIALKSGATATADALLTHCRERLAQFKCPCRVAFGPWPRTSTVKMQKFALHLQLRKDTV